MDILPSGCFIPVSVEKVKSKPFWINNKLAEQLSETKDLLDSLSPVALAEDIHKPFTCLGIKTKTFSKPFASSEEWQQFQKEVIYLKTERFFDPYNRDCGSGRNAILGPSHYKGIGRNHAASREDWLHCWGGMTIEEALSEIFFERLLENSFPEASVPLLGGFLYHDVPQAFIIRTSNFIRCDQIHPKFRSGDKEKVTNYLSRVFYPHKSDQWHKLIVARFMDLMKKGFFHGSPTAGNLTIDGRLLDHYSMEWVENNSAPGGLFCEYYFQTPLIGDFSRDELIKIIQSSPVKYIETNYDFVLRQCLIIKDLFTILDLKVLMQEQIEAELRTQFPYWSDYIIKPEERLATFSSLITKRMINFDDVKILKTHYGSISIDIGQRKRKSVVLTITHLLNFINHIQTEKNTDDLTSILISVSQKFCNEDIIST